MIYKPTPIPTAEIELDSGLQELVERLAESNHDHWARQRMDQGWIYGPERDDQKMTHPDLLPYDQLSESEKGYDRTSVIETLKAIIAAGYEIRRRDS